MLDEDHRKLGKRLGLFHFQDEAPGMVFWHPRGFLLYRVLEQAVRARMRADGYQEVRSPQLLRCPIWQASGHWQHFRDGMFVLGDGEFAAALKPVSCPGHVQIALRMAPSYRDLPIRLGELGLVHRAEQSGCLHGLLRVRQFSQDDGHVFCREDQVEAELSRFMRSLLDFYGAFGIAPLRVAFSSRPALRAGSDEVWDRAESLLLGAASAAGIDCERQPGEGAFYGPKIEVLLDDRAGKAWQCGTLQLDFFSAERFGLGYVDAAGARRHPVMLHRALCGSLERFIGLLFERHGARLPEWFAPEQLAVLPVFAEQAPYAEQVVEELSASGLRAVLDARPERLSRRVRDAHERGVPLIGVVGQREMAEGALALREPDGQSSALALKRASSVLVERFRPPV